jgi:hypothetical protein
MMMKKYTTTIVVSLVVILLLVSLSLAGKYNEQRAYRVTPQDIEKWDQQLNSLQPTEGVNPPHSAAAVEFGRTWYDYHTNNITARMHNYAANGIHVVYMKRMPNAAATRYTTYDYFDNTLGIFFGNQSVTEASATGWGRVLNGVNDEALICMHGGGLRFFQDASEAGYTFAQLLHITTAGVFPGIARLGNTVVFMGQKANVAGQSWSAGDTIVVSTDYMANWTGHNVWEEPVGMLDYGVAEMWPTIDPTNPSEFSVVYAPANRPDAPNGSTRYATTPDLGATFSTFHVWDDDTLIQNGPNVQQYIIENFSQMNSMYTSDGVYHIVMGGVQGVTDTSSASINMWPILYWNTRDQVMLELTDPYYGRPTNQAAWPLIQNNRPGNGIGNAYPILAEGPNAGELICIWQQWEDDGTGVPVMLNATLGTGTVQIFSTDIWGAYTGDGGVTWSEPFFVAGTAGVSDVFPMLPDKFIYNTAQDSIYLDILYMVDTNPGVSVFTSPNSDPSECIWYYERVPIFAGGPSGVGVRGNTVSDFRLAQNYPNPFNPSTTISFNLKTSGKVALDVYNTLGQKVATVFNKNMQAGQHQIEFDASNLASGVYLYKLSSGNLTQTRKMMLMK